MTNPSQLTALVADLGGTNTRVALTDGALVRTETIKRFRNADYPDLVSVLRGYMADWDIVPDAACVAMAGPVSAEMHQIQMLNRGEAGPMVFEPDFLRIEPGDTVIVPD